MKAIILLLGLFAIAFSDTLKSPPRRGALSCKDYGHLWRIADTIIDNSNGVNVPDIVRLAFHDCVGTSCDGCINHDDPLNGGIGFASNNIDNYYDNNSLSYIVSRADFYQLVAQVALVRGVYNRQCDPQKEHCPFFNIKFQAGRQDCKTSPLTDAVDGFPNAHGDFREYIRVFTKMMKMDDRDIAAIMGTHSLGGAHSPPGFSTGSGFINNWQLNPLKFDNQYFINLLSLYFTHRETSQNQTFIQLFGPRFQFETKPFVGPDNKPTTIMMLNSDVALIKDVRAIPTKDGKGVTGGLTCGGKRLHDGEVNAHKHCSTNQRTYKFIAEYAQDLEKFYSDFSIAWWKMVNFGYIDWQTGQSSLYYPGEHEHQYCADCVPVGGVCVAGHKFNGRCCGETECINGKCTPHNERHGDGHGHGDRHQNEQINLGRYFN